MRLFPILLLAATGVAGLTSANAAPVPAPTHTPGHAQAAALDAVIRERMRQARIPGAAVAHVRDGRIVYLRTFGERAPGVPMTPDARFNVASLTKPVFATLVARLVAKGQWSYDTPLAESWVDPDIAEDDRRFALTARMTLSHQSGLPNWRNGRMTFLFDPGTRHEYSGEGFEYTRKAIEQRLGRSMPELMRTHVMRQAGMRHSSFGWDDAIAGLEVTGYDEAGQPLPTAHLRERRPNAAANLFSTIGDYARFARWIGEGGGLPAALRREIATPQAMHPDPAEDFGLGWRLIRMDAGTVLAHDGRESGVRTQVYVLPHAREALVILTNSNHGELLVGPVAETALRDGQALIRRSSQDIWRYMHSIPAAGIVPMSQGISRSPSFMWKALSAVDATLVAGADVSPALRQRAHAAIEPFVIGMVQGQVTQDRALGVFGQLVDGQGDATRLRTTFTPAQAEAWVAALEAAVR